MMQRFVLFAASVALVGAACSSTPVNESFEPAVVGENPVPGVSSSPTTTTPELSTSSSENTTSTMEPSAAPEGPAAPDFTLALEPDGEFVLSQEVKPVYMVFWAEW